MFLSQLITGGVNIFQMDDNKFFFEKELDSHRYFYRIFVFLLVIATALGGILLYFVFTSEIEKNPILAEARCGFEEASTRNIGGVARDMKGVQSLIEQSVDESSLAYMSLKPTKQCDNDVGMWFNNHDGSRMYVYCLGLSQGRLIRFERVDCSKLDHEKAVADSFGTIINATLEKPLAQSQ
jgi:hypothetical protein